jgi:hypothetical protein
MSFFSTLPTFAISFIEERGRMGVEQGGFKSETMRKSLIFAKEEEMLYVHVITQGVLKNTQEDED